MDGFSVLQCLLESGFKIPRGDRCDASHLNLITDTYCLILELCVSQIVHHLPLPEMIRIPIMDVCPRKSLSFSTDCHCGAKYVWSSALITFASFICSLCSFLLPIPFIPRLFIHLESRCFSQLKSLATRSITQNLFK